jgi:alpha-tubulin suppressor-like RCC1 family protein/endonuclease/exonuclease/phosphatase family metal-dependent hydrolase
VKLRAAVLGSVLSLALLVSGTYAVASPDVAAPAASPRAGSGTAPGAVARVSAGGQHSCEIRGDGSLWCWGSNVYGQLGNGRQGPGVNSPERVGTGTDWRKVSADGHDTCGIKSNQNLFCWGLNHRGQVGDGTHDVRTTPKRVGDKHVWAQVDTGWFHTCGVRTNGTLWCWGDNSAGQLGIGSTDDTSTGARLPGHAWAQVSVEGWNTCATKEDGSLWCWGRNLVGQLGNGTWVDSSTPSRVGTSTNWRRVAVTWTHACAIKRGGAVRCWGRNQEGQLGDGDLVTSNKPRAVAGAHRARDIAVSEQASCLVDREDQTWCWGSNNYGQVAPGAPLVNPTPVRRTGPEAAVTGGWLHLCAVDAADQSSCWGNDEQGQLGDGAKATPRSQSGSTAASGSQRATAARATGGPYSFTIATMNALGNGHTRPYAKDDHFAPSRMRAEWTAGAIEHQLGASIVGVQETTAGQLQGIIDATNGAYASFQTPDAGDLGVESALLWKKSVWEATQTEVIKTQFIRRDLPRPVVKLRNRATGREIWVMNVHNAPWEYQAKRNAAAKEEIAKLQELEATGLPVFFIGDMNEKQTIFCKVLRDTQLVSPLGGSYRKGTCTPPKGVLRVDWIFGSKSVGFEGYRTSRDTLVRLSTDHWVPVVRVNVP